MTRPSVIRVLGAVAVLGWIACYVWSLTAVADADVVDAETVATVLTNLAFGFALSMPFFAVLGFALLERDR